MDIKDQIDRLIISTRENKIDWKTLSAEAFRWNRFLNNVNYYTTFQAVNLSDQLKNIDNNDMFEYLIESYIGNGAFTLTIQTDNETILQLNASRSVNSEYLSPLFRLYKSIINFNNRNVSNILDNLLNDL